MFSSNQTAECEHEFIIMTKVATAHKRLVGKIKLSAQHKTIQQ